jgi:hypothetical protein
MGSMLDPPFADALSAMVLFVRVVCEKASVDGMNGQVIQDLPNALSSLVGPNRNHFQGEFGNGWSPGEGQAFLPGGPARSAFLLVVGCFLFGH